MIELYYNEGCPFCLIVLDFIQQNNIKFTPKEVPLYGSSPLKEEMVKLGGKSQVPFLVDPEKKTQMYESLDIIDYLKKHYLPTTR